MSEERKSVRTLFFPEKGTDTYFTSFFTSLASHHIRHSAALEQGWLRERVLLPYVGRLFDPG